MEGIEYFSAFQMATEELIEELLELLPIESEDECDYDTEFTLFPEYYLTIIYIIKFTANKLPVRLELHYSTRPSSNAYIIQVGDKFIYSPQHSSAFNISEIVNIVRKETGVDNEEMASC